MRTLTAASLSLALLAGAALTAGAQEKKNPAATPAPRNKGWVQRHEGFVKIAKKGNVNVLFLGDSITDAWRGKAAKKAWDKNFAPLGSANFGIGGDQTQHVLWRIQNGELDGITPKVAVLMIGTNNVGGHSAEQIAGGITAIVDTIHKKSPSTKVLLLGVFPRDAKPDSPRRAKIAKINQIISDLGKRDYVRYMDIGQKFLKDDGTLTRDVMPDLLHLSEQGYTIWGDAIAPTVRQMLGKQ